MIKQFAKLFEFKDIGQVLVTIDSSNDENKTGPELSVQFVPHKNLGVCAVRTSFTDDDDGWDKAELAFKNMDEAAAYKIASLTGKQLSGVFDE
ncbi:MAG: hypothetical protein RR740_00250 [Pseudomonas sp.]